MLHGRWFLCTSASSHPTVLVAAQLDPSPRPFLAPPKLLFLLPCLRLQFTPISLTIVFYSLHLPSIVRLENCCTNYLRVIFLRAHLPRCIPGQ